MLNDKNTTIFNLKYRKGFLILVSGKGIEILYHFFAGKFQGGARSLCKPR